MKNKISDNDIVNYYRTEYFKDWYNAWINGIKLTPSDIRIRLGIK